MKRKLRRGSASQVLRVSGAAASRRGHATASVCLTVAALALAPRAITAAVIIVEGDCTLVDAINAANDDVAVGGCPAGSGADEIQLTSDVQLTAPYQGKNGLPTVGSAITIKGAGFAIEGSFGDMRIFNVAPNGGLGLESVIVRGGELLNSPGGAIFSTGVLTLTDSTISDNLGLHGGGISIDGGYLRMDRTTVRDNNACCGYPYTEEGGGLHLTAGEALLVDATISNNSAAIGGGIFVRSPANLTLVNTTIASNSGGPFGASNLEARSSQPLMVRSIMASFGQEYEINCGLGTRIEDGGGNFDDDGSCEPGFGDLTGLDPELEDNGGPTLTHALLPESSAVDAVDCGLRVDQRGVPRDGACDSGAFELSPELILAGSCPGELTLTLGGLTPGGEAAIAWSPDAGRRELAQGPCAGRMIDLGAPKLLALLTADANGDVSLTRNVPAGGCGVLLQAVDAATCHTSKVEPVPVPVLRTRR